MSTVAPAENDKMMFFEGQIERNRVLIVKEIGGKIQHLKSSIKSMTRTLMFMNVAMFILSVVCSFGMTNFLLGLKIDTTKSVLNLTTNFPFLACISAVTLVVSLIMDNSVYNLIDAKKNQTSKDTLIPKFIVGVSTIFMFMAYAVNLLYYKEVPGFSSSAFYISTLFVGALAVVSTAAGYFKAQIKEANENLMNSEYRPDFEAVINSYRKLIHSYVNFLSKNRLENIRGSLLNNQFKMIVESFIGILTAPFLAYGVSNTLAMCFPEAASWVRISGIRFSPIFLVLSTFLIVFAFFTFVTAFAITKQIKSSEIIKFDGFHDYNLHGVTILGVDSVKGLNKEKTTLLCIAFGIILIEFTMNVSYFITEIGGDLNGIFLSLVVALVPTALLIAETNLLSSTMHKINNYNDVLSMLD